MRLRKAKARKEVVMAQPQLRPLSDLEVSQSVMDRLSRNNDRVRKGGGDDIRHPVFKNVADEDVLSEWDEIFHSQPAKLRPTLAQMEESNRSKFGPRSVAKTWEERRDSTYAYFNDEGGLGLPELERKGSYRPITTAEAARSLIPSTSSGLPFMQRKGEVLPQVVLDHQSLLERNDPCVLFTRTQEQRKTRDIWGFPVAETLAEMRYFRVLLKMRQRLSIHRAALIGPDAVEEAVTYLIDRAVARKRQLLSIDFEAFDASCQPRLSGPALRTLLSVFQHTEEIDRIIDRYQHIGLVTPDGILEGPHGTPSGSTLTNEAGSEIQMRIAEIFGLVDYTVQGDDGVHVTDAPEEFKSFCRDYGLKVNDEKSHIAGDEAIYLQSYFHSSYAFGSVYGAVYPTYRALNRIVHMERWATFPEGLSGDDYFALRCVSILENCKRHPYFKPLVHFIASKDKNKLKFDSGALPKYLDLVTKGRAGIQHQHGDLDLGRPRGIAQFETVEVLKREVW